MNPTIEHNFKYHPPVGSAQLKHQAIRAKAKELAALIDASLPAAAGREKAMAITKVEEAMMWACAGVARHSKEEGEVSTCVLCGDKIEREGGNWFHSASTPFPHHEPKPSSEVNQA